MKKTIPALLFTLISFLFVQNTFSQYLEDNYYIVVLKGDIIKNVLHDFEDFKYFDLSYLQLDDGNYTIAGYAKNDKDEQLGNLITLDIMTSIKPRHFKNLEKGHLYLNLTTMKNHNVDGTEDYILTPKKCKDIDGVVQDYVSYRFSNKVENAISLLAPNVVKAFNLNPSPPY